MKNLKKVLSMMLALTMAMSLMTSAFAADNKDYTDTDKVSYNEAVEVMSAAGVFSGSNGKFDPQGSLTREQAAKIITYMVMGKDSADKLVSTIAPYADVNASRWSAGSIAYCTTQGIVAGSAGKFNPTAKVTGVEFAKMLLGALGYDAKIEKMLGAEWAVNTATLAVDAGLADDMKDVALSATLTREQAAQMAFNAMQADMVKYDNKGTEIKLPDGTKVVVGASDAEAVEQGSYTNNLKKDNLQFAEKYSTDLKKVSTTDDFGRPSSQWKMKNNEIGNYADTADASYTTEVKLGDIYSDLGLSQQTVPTVFEDGKDLKNKTNNSFTLFKGNNKKIGDNGVLTEAFVDDDNNVTIVEINTYVGKVNKTVAASGNKDAYVQITAESVKPDGMGGSADFDTNATFEDDAYVLYTYANGEVQSVTPAKSVSGEVSSYAEKKNLTVNGTKYDYSAKNTIGSLNTKTDYVIYLDAYDFAIATDDAKFVSTDYAYVLKSQGKNNGSWDENKVELLFTDGTTKIVNTDKNYVGNNHDFVTFKVNDKNEYVLRRASGSTEIAENETFNLTKGTAAITTGISNKPTVYANSETIFLVRTKTGSNEEAFNAYTGISEVPSIKAGTNKKVSAEYYTKSNGSIVTMMYIDAYNAESVSTSSKDITFLAGESISGKITDGDNNQYYTYNAVVKGELTTVKVDTNTNVANIMENGALKKGVVNALFSNVTTNSDGIITGLKEYNTNPSTGAYTKNTVGTVKVSGKDTLGFGKDKNKDVVYYTAAKDCKVFYADEDGVLTAGSISGISTDDNDLVYYVVDDGEVTNVFIQTVEEGKTPDSSQQSAKYTVDLKNNNGTATVTVTSNSDTEVDVTGTVTMTNTNSSAGAISFDITAGKVKKGNNYTYTFSTNNTSVYKVTVNVGGETLTSGVVVGG